MDFRFRGKNGHAATSPQTDFDPERSSGAFIGAAYRPYPQTPARKRGIIPPLHESPNRGPGSMRGVGGRSKNRLPYNEKVDADDVVACVVHRLIAGQIGFAEDRRRAIKRFIQVDELDFIGAAYRPYPQTPARKRGYHPSIA